MLNEWLRFRLCLQIIFSDLQKHVGVVGCCFDLGPAEYSASETHHSNRRKKKSTRLPAAVMETERLLKDTKISVEAADLTEKRHIHLAAKEHLQISETTKVETIVDMKLLEKLNCTSEEDAAEWENSCVYRVPPHIREINPEAYTPKLVSFGPYHHGAPHLAQMEKHKHRALSHVLKRSKKSFEDYLTALKPMTKKLMESYRDLDEKWKVPDKFLQLMVLDGIFLIEIDRVYFKTDPKFESDYSQNDPMFSSNVSPFTSVDLKNDIMLLENQLPCFLLGCISDISKRPMTRRERHKKQSIRTEEEAAEGGKECRTTSLHYLDYIRTEMIGNHRQDTQKLSYIFYSASELHKAGIVFERKDEHDSVLDITFDKEKGILSLPRIDVYSSMGKRLLNMVAFESLHPSVGLEIRAYIQFITSLTHDANDVLLLRTKGVISTSLLDNEKIAELLQKLQHDMAHRPKTCYAELRIDMHDFCQKNMKKWNRRFREWRVNLTETYFNNPWSFMSLFAAAVLLNITVLGAIYSVLSYYKSGK